MKQLVVCIKTKELSGIIMKLRDNEATDKVVLYLERTFIDVKNRYLYRDPYQGLLHWYYYASYLFDALSIKC